MTFSSSPSSSPSPGPSRKLSSSLLSFACPSAVLGLSVLASACAQLPQQPPANLALTDPNRSIIYVYRTAAEAARAQPFYVTVDGKPATPLGNGSYLMLLVPPGQHQIIVSPGAYGFNRGVTFKAMPGENQYFQFTFREGADPSRFADTALQARDLATARNGLAGLTRAVRRATDREPEVAASAFAALADVAALPGVPEPTRVAYLKWLGQRQPRAFVIGSDGSWVSAWGMLATDLPGVSDPATRAMHRCAARKDVLCQLYAVNDSVVWHPLPAPLLEAERQHLAAAGANPPVAQGMDESAVQPPRLRAYTPVFGQLVTYGLPAGFRQVFRKVTRASYITEFVPIGEGVQRWSQRVTVTGARSVAANPAVTPETFGAGLAAGFRTACPASFAYRTLSTAKRNGRDEQVFIVSCGTRNTDYGDVSETALIQVIKGKEDIYTVQWAERGDASARPLALDMGKWLERFSSMAPVQLCEPLPGERPPYPSCARNEDKGAQGTPGAHGDGNDAPRSAPRVPDVRRPGNPRQRGGTDI